MILIKIIRGFISARRVRQAKTALDLIQNWNLKTNLLAGCLTHPAFIIMLMNE